MPQKIALILVLVFLVAPFVAAIMMPAPGIEIEIANKTTLTITTDVSLVLRINNTKLSENYGVDVYTIAIINYQFQCSIRGEKSAIYVIQTPTATQTISFAQETMDICLGDETRITRLNATFIVVSRGGLQVATYYADLTEVAAKLTFVPEWRALAFKVETGYVDRCNWVQYNLRATYGGDIGIIKIISQDCFNVSKALRVAYQPYYYYLTKYIKVVVRMEIGNATVEKDLTGGGELILPSSGGPYGDVKNFTIEVTGPQNRYVLRPTEYTGSITIIPVPIERRGLAGVVVATYYSPPYTVVEMLLNDTVTPEGLHVVLTPAPQTPTPYIYAEVKTPNKVAIYILAQTPGAAGGNLTITYTGPGVVKQGQVAIPPTPVQPVKLSRATPLVKATYYPIKLTQPQPLISVTIPILPGTVATYVEANMTIKPRDPHAPTYIYILPLVNKSGILMPLPPGVLHNSTNPGTYRAYLNGTVQLRWLIPTPPGESLVVYIYGDNVASYKVPSGRAYVLTAQAEQNQPSPTPSPTQIASIAIMTAGAVAFSVLYIITERRR
jgi:hypothetical protein